MKKCIWCLKKEGEVPFNKESHILPQNLGSKEICINVCDPCNEYFGEKTGKNEPSIDIALKEMLVLSKYQMLGPIIKIQNQAGKEFAKNIFGKFIGDNIIQTLNRDTEFFLIEEKNGKIGFSATNSFKHHFHNPSILTNRLKRGLFKVAFETAYNEDLLSKHFQSFLDSFFDYIRDFVRYNIGDLKIFYLQRKEGAQLMTIDNTANPKVLLYGIEENYLKFEILGHVFGISIGKSNLTEHLFLRNYQKSDALFKPLEVKTFLDIDIFNRVFNK